MCAETSAAILAGTFALAGVALSISTSALLSLWDKNHKRKVLLREKYEELSYRFLASFEMPQKLMSYQGNKEEVLSLTHQKYGNQAHMLALLYFHQLQESTGQYIQTYSNLCVVSHSLYNPNNNLLLGEQVYDNPKYIAARNAHIAARDHLQEQIKKYATKYANV
ncbi:MAG: hypothetical protein OEV89_04890 [Desulfobulbaceae bacterium]|nr:hypothetical protein [Desulfobulbaceae bacterium]HIJ90085.1 hypothetical protein [Deltaproteobacteria bacterium]